MQLSSIVLSTLMGAGVSAQLLPTFVPEEVSTNFKLRAVVDPVDANRTGANVFHNWLVGVAGHSNRCYKELTLQKPEEHDNTTFWFESERQLIHSAQSPNTSFSFGMKTFLDTNQLTLACGHPTPHIGVNMDGTAPVLQYALDGLKPVGRWLACENFGSFDLLYQQPTHPANLQDNCVPVKLFSECAEGDEHGLSDVSVCCKVTHDGMCGMPPQENKSADEDKSVQEDKTAQDNKPVQQDKPTAEDRHYAGHGN